MVSFDDVEKLITQHASPGIRPGLERIERLLSLLGNPQGTCPAVHVVGTNGKGSTCAFLASVFHASGYKTALYTSPHLENPGERLLVDNFPLPPERWMNCAERAARAIDEDSVLKSDPPSYFELVTTVAFLLIEEENAEVAIVEAGLGGRLDATNLLSDVACTVVASISMDHTEYLGDTLEKIAGEKFAVVKANTPACYLGDAPSLVPLFENFCSGAGAKPFVVSQDVELGKVTITHEGCMFDFSTAGLELTRIQTKLLGRYQVSNAALALLAISCLKKRFNRIMEPAIRVGMMGARWPGRLEVISRGLRGQGQNPQLPLVVLDGGHNVDGVKKLAESVTELWGDKQVGIVYGVMKDKDYSRCLEILHALKPAFYATCVPGLERGLSAKKLAESARFLTWRNSGDPDALIGFENPLEAAAAALKENDIVVVCGSLYLIGWVRPRIGQLLEN